MNYSSLIKSILYNQSKNLTQPTTIISNKNKQIIIGQKIETKIITIVSCEQNFKPYKSYKFFNS